MFTGIIEETGTIRTIRKEGHSLRITISADRITSDMKVGDSINTDGVCLTVTSFSSGDFTVEVMPETFNRSGLSKIGPGDKVNLERALRLTDRLGGHIVSGHIDGTGKISRTWKDENAIWYTIAADANILKYVVEKGSVAIDGISLTVARVDGYSMDVSLIPHTQKETTLSGKRQGSQVNIECDILGKYIEKFSGKEKGDITLDFLQKMGF